MNDHSYDSGESRRTLEAWATYHDRLHPLGGAPSWRDAALAGRLSWKDALTGYLFEFKPYSVATHRKIRPLKETPWIPTSDSSGTA